MHCFLFLTIADQHEQDTTHTLDDATETTLDDARPLDSASTRNCPQNTYFCLLNDADYGLFSIFNHSRST